MTVPKLLVKVHASGRTYCGRTGCSGWFGLIAPVGGRRVHLLDPEWTLRDGTWRRKRSRSRPGVHHADWPAQLPPNVQAIAPDDNLECTRCKAVQRLPDGAAVDRFEGLRLHSVVLMSEID